MNALFYEKYKCHVICNKAKYRLDGLCMCGRYIHVHVGAITVVAAARGSGAVARPEIESQVRAVVCVYVTVEGFSGR